ncbi:hypothetical protein K439DRAFT_1543999 [Ramaria rubella]|nr:hypothetical protein K439DRAFT_1543999 [Ramaria rubella]
MGHLNIGSLFKQLAEVVKIMDIYAMPHILVLSIHFSQEFILRRGIRDPKGTGPPLMGLTLGNAIVQPVYEDAILCIKKSARGTHQSTWTSKAWAKAAKQTQKTTEKHDTEGNPQPPTAVSLARAQKRQEKQCKDCLACNQQEIEAHDMNPDVLPQPLATSFQQPARTPWRAGPTQTAMSQGARVAPTPGGGCNVCVAL